MGKAVRAQMSADPNNLHWAHGEGRSGVAAKMMAKMGWTEGSGLGRDGQGSDKHVAVVRRSADDVRGIGIGLTSAGKGSVDETDDGRGWRDNTEGYRGLLQRLGEKYTPAAVADSGSSSSDSSDSSSDASEGGNRASSKRAGAKKRRQAKPPKTRTSRSAKRHRPDTTTSSKTRRRKASQKESSSDSSDSSSGSTSSDSSSASSSFSVSSCSSSSEWEEDAAPVAPRRTKVVAKRAEHKRSDSARARHLAAYSRRHAHRNAKNYSAKDMAAILGRPTADAPAKRDDATPERDSPEPADSPSSEDEFAPSQENPADAPTEDELLVTRAEGTQDYFQAKMRALGFLS